MATVMCVPVILLVFISTILCWEQQCILITLLDSSFHPRHCIELYCICKVLCTRMKVGVEGSRDLRYGDIKNWIERVLESVSEPHPCQVVKANWLLFILDWMEYFCQNCVNDRKHRIFYSILLQLLRKG